MDEFGYLSVLLSIIIGLAVTEILQGMRRRMLTHARVKSYWPTDVWAFTLLVICAQSWWAMFGLRNRHDWNFEQFAVVLAQTIVLYLAVGLVFPEFEGNAEIDLREHYFRQRKGFCALLAIAVIISVAKDWILGHSLPDSTNLIYHGVFFICALSGIAIAREWFQKLLAVAMALAFISYIALLFARLH